MTKQRNRYCIPASIRRAGSAGLPRLFGDDILLLHLFAVDLDEGLLPEDDLGAGIRGVAFDAQHLAVEAAGAAPDEHRRPGRRGAHESAVDVLVAEYPGNLQFADQVLDDRVGFGHALVDIVVHHDAVLGAAFFEPWEP